MSRHHTRSITHSRSSPRSYPFYRVVVYAGGRECPRAWRRPSPSIPCYGMGAGCGCRHCQPGHDLWWHCAFCATVSDYSTHPQHGRLFHACLSDSAAGQCSAYSFLVSHLLHSCCLPLQCFVFCSTVLFRMFLQFSAPVDFHCWCC